MNQCAITEAALINFGIYLAVASCFIAGFGVLYVWFTPYREIKLIKEGNRAAAISFSCAMLAFCFTLASLIKAAANVVEVSVWAGIAVVLQLTLFALVRKIFPFVVEEVEKGEVAGAIFLGGLSLVTGIITAVCIS